ncbi:MAG TPA: plasmid pRiA4b ORF-3 family protein [Thermoguttaceae bacterium]
MSQPIFIFKVALAGRKSIWRRIALKGNQTLDDFHEAIFDAFDRDDEHLYSFYFPTSLPKRNFHLAIRDAPEYTHPYAFDSDYQFETDAENAAKVKLSSLRLKPKQIFYYLFDFGDEWWHEITVEDTESKAERGKYPRILEKKGKSPPQYVYDDDEYDDE